MVDTGWRRQTAAAAGVAAGTGAAQLGLGYGLGVVVWPAEATTDAIWLSSLGWAIWIAASSAVLGAVAAHRLHSGTPAGSVRARRRGPWRLAIAAAAAIGALLTVALIAVPARAAVRADTSAPQTVAAGYAVVGVLLGLVMAYGAVVNRSMAANVVATVGWIWALAVAALVHALVTRRTVDTTHLGGWQFTGPGDGFRFGTVYWPGAVLTLVAAFVIGVLASRPAIRRGDRGTGTALSGAAGPLLVAAAFFVLAPQLTGAVGELQSAYLIAPYAVLAGLAGSASTVAAGQRLAGRSGSAAPATEPAAFPLGAPADPTPSRPPVATAADDSTADANRTQSRSPVGTPADDSTADVDVSPSRTADRPATATGRARLPKARTGTGPEPAPIGSASASGRGPTAADPVTGTPGRPSGAGTGGPARSTVTAPPATPTVVQINPVPTGAGEVPAGVTADGPDHAAAGKGRMGSRKGGPAHAKPGNAGPAGPPSTTSGQKSPSAATASGAGAGNVSRPEAASAEKKAPSVTAAPLWVEDGPANSDDDRDGVRNRFRRFGRRSGPDGEPKGDAGPRDG